MKLASVLLHIAIAASLAAALSIITGHGALGVFSFAALAFLGAIAAHDYSPRTVNLIDHTRVNSSRHANPLRLAV